MTQLLVPSRRGFLLGLGAAVSAPALVRAGSLMRVKALPAEQLFIITGNTNNRYTLEAWAEKVLNPAIDRLVNKIRGDFEHHLMTGAELQVGDVVSFSAFSTPRGLN